MKGTSTSLVLLFLIVVGLCSGVKSFVLDPRCTFAANSRSPYYYSQRYSCYRNACSQSSNQYSVWAALNNCDKTSNGNNVVRVSSLRKTFNHGGAYRPKSPATSATKYYYYKNQRALQRRPIVNTQYPIINAPSQPPSSSPPLTVLNNLNAQLQAVCQHPSNANEQMCKTMMASSNNQRASLRQPVAASTIVSSPSVATTTTTNQRTVYNNLEQNLKALCANPTTAGDPLCANLVSSSQRQGVNSNNFLPAALRGTASMQEDSAAPATNISGSSFIVSPLQSGIGNLNASSGIIAVILLITGLTLVFFGHMLFKPVLFIVGFYIFAAIAFSILSAIEVSSGMILFGANRSFAFLILVIVFGLMGGLLFMCVWRLGLAAVGAIFGFFVAIFVLSLWSNGVITSGVGRSIFIALLSVLGAVLISIFEKPLLILGTAFPGAYAFVFGLDIFINSGFNMATQMFLYGQGLYVTSPAVYGLLALVLILGVIGTFVQFHTYRKGFKERSQYQPQAEVDKEAIWKTN